MCPLVCVCGWVGVWTERKRKEKGERRKEKGDRERRVPARVGTQLINPIQSNPIQSNPIQCGASKMPDANGYAFLLLLFTCLLLY
jgi:hypothetical protein